MGYILPIHHVTYTDYHKRIQPTKINRYTIHRSYPILELENEEFTFNQYNFFDNRKVEKASTFDEHNKGKYINTYV